jgi:hypothetical protein
VKSSRFPHHNISKLAWRSRDGKTDNHIDRILIDKRSHSSAPDVGQFRAVDYDTDQCLVLVKARERLAVG